MANLVSRLYLEDIEQYGQDVGPQVDIVFAFEFLVQVGDFIGL